MALFVDQGSRSLVALGNDPLFGCGASTAAMPGGGSYVQKAARVRVILASSFPPIGE